MDDSQPLKKSSWKRVSRYKDVSTDDELDADDPVEMPDAVIDTWRDKKDLASKVQPKATHIIYMCEEQGYLALVTKVSKNKVFY